MGPGGPPDMRGCTKKSQRGMAVGAQKWCRSKEVEMEI